MKMSKALQTGRSRLGRASPFRSRRSRRPYLAGSALATGGLLLLVIPVVVLRRRAVPPDTEPEIVEEAAPESV